MDVNQVIQWNIDIAKFLGFQKTELGWFNNCDVNVGEFDNTFDSLYFHNDWNWLMAAVKDIEVRGYDVIINTCTCVITDCGQGHFDNIETYNEEGVKFNAVYEAVYIFVKWFNK